MKQPLKMKLVGGPKFYQKYAVLKREKIPKLFSEYMRAIYNSDVDESAVKQFTDILDGMMNLQGMHYFVVNLDEKEGQAAMVAYWSQMGYTPEEILSCLPRDLKK